MSALETSRVRVTALLRRSDVARISEPHAEISTAGVIIAERTEIALGKSPIPGKVLESDQPGVPYIFARNA